MHIYFSGIGGSAIGPLAIIAKQAGYKVSGSDAQDSSYIKYLTSQGITDIHVGQSQEQIAAVHAAKPVDWLVYSSALPKTDPNHPELVFAKANAIRTSKRDELLNQIITDKKLKIIAVAGTHGKTTTTAMVIWLFKQLRVPVSYSVGAKLSFGKMGQFQEGAQYFIYEADEYDRNFLAFYPYTSLISGVDWDHPDIYPTREAYYRAFTDFINQSRWVVLWRDDARKLNLQAAKNHIALDKGDPDIDKLFKLVGEVNRQNAWLVAKGMYEILDKPQEELVAVLNKFPGLSRRWEEIAQGIYSDYAHTPSKIRGALQLAHEVASDNVVVVYEGLHNLRQHFIKDDLKRIFDDVKQLYIVPSYLAREDPNLPTLSPAELIGLLSEKTQAHASPARLDEELKQKIEQHAGSGDSVLCLSAGGGGSLDEWLRQQFRT